MVSLRDLLAFGLLALAPRLNVKGGFKVRMGVYPAPFITQAGIQKMPACFLPILSS